MTHVRHNQKLRLRIDAMTFEDSHKPIAFAGAHIRTIGERLTFLRRREGMTLTDAANQSGVSKSELSRLENDSRRLKDHHIEALARLYGVEARSLRSLLSSDLVESLANNQFLPCYALAALTGTGKAQANVRMMQLPFALKLGPDAYMIAIDEAGDIPVAARSIVVIDPAARPVLGDLVANIGAWTPPLMILRRDAQGRFIGNGQAGQAGDFHKAVACFSQSHFR